MSGWKHPQSILEREITCKQNVCWLTRKPHRAVWICRSDYLLSNLKYLLQLNASSTANTICSGVLWCFLTKYILGAVVQFSTKLDFQLASIPVFTIWAWYLCKAVMDLCVHSVQNIHQASRMSCFNFKGQRSTIKAAVNQQNPALVAQFPNFSLHFTQ